MGGREHPVGMSATLAAGRPHPLGAHCVGPRGAGGVNFAVWAPDAERVELCLFDDSGRCELQRLELPRCTDGVWHGLLAGAGPGLVYGLRAHGPWAPQRGHRFNPAKVLLDPWAREVVGRYEGELDLHLGHDPADPARPDPRDNAAVALKARVAPALATRRHRRPSVPADRTVLYEAHVKALTMRHPDVPKALRGSYAALAHPALIAHLHALGVTTLSLLPLHFRADEAALQRAGLSNHWGYSPIAWLAPETRYWSGRRGTSPASELRAAVARLHAGGIEVVLDVVFNHTAETDAAGPTLSLRGLANARAYHLDPTDPARYRNWSGCGNCVDLGEPRMIELAIGALRHWAEEYGVDGFRFDLAPMLARRPDGSFDRRAGFFAALQADPLLSSLKLIAEPWDPGPEGYQLGRFPPGWAEWNDQFRDNMRGWWLRGAADRAVFAHRFAASSTQFHYQRRAPVASINFISAHDGFTLRDLVSYDRRHNEANGEGNHDGHHHNCSWNAGVEGPSDDPEVRALRARLQRALLATLLCSQGTPMLLAGDELGHSQGGNNNAYCQDNEITWLDWAAADTALTAFVARLLTLRQAHAALRQAQWLTGPQDDPEGHTVAWLHPQGHALDFDDWHDRDSRAIAIWLRARHEPATPRQPPLLLLINPHGAPQAFVLPYGDWQPLFDSAVADGRPATATRAASAHDGRLDTIETPARGIVILVDQAATGTFRPARTVSETIPK